jgi:hypothetical protein
VEGFTCLLSIKRINIEGQDTGTCTSVSVPGLQTKVILNCIMPGIITGIIINFNFYSFFFTFVMYCTLYGGINERFQREKQSNQTTYVNDINRSKPGGQREQDNLNRRLRKMILLQLEWKRSLQICLLLRGILSLDLKEE